MFPVQVGNWIGGSVVRVFSLRRRVWHFGILCDYGLVTHASKDHGKIVITSLAEFAKGQQVDYVRQPTSWEEQEMLVHRAKSRIGTAYNLLNANCEDFVNWVVTGKAQSPQRNQHLAFVAVAIGLGLVLCGIFGTE